MHTIYTKVTSKSFNRNSWIKPSTTLDSFKLLLADQSLAKIFIEFDYHEDKNVPMTPPECSCHVGIFSLEMYRALLPYQCPLHQSTSLESRFSSAKLAIEYGGSIKVVRDILPPEWTANLKVIHTTESLMHSVALRLSDYVSGYYPSNTWPLDNTEVWFQFAIEVIRHTPDVHHTSHTYYDPWLAYGEVTALTTLLLHALTMFNIHIEVEKIPEPNALPKSLVLWLRAVRKAGVDLNTYGKREHQLLVDSNVSQQRRMSLNFANNYSVSVFRIVGFTYGPNPEDWKVFWNEPTDQFAGQFWGLIENPPLHIPGSWVDDHDDYYDYYERYDYRYW